LFSNFGASKSRLVVRRRAQRGQMPSLWARTQPALPNGRCQPHPHHQPQTTLAERRLKRFTERVTKPRQPPLLELPGDVAALSGCAPPSLPKRSRWIATQATAHIPTAKRGEYLVMKRLGLSSRMLPP
jgi:hypothetical protein